MKVLTVKGPLDLESLHVRDVVEIVDNGRKVATEYFCAAECRPAVWPAGDLVKRTVTVDVLMPFELAASHGQLS